MAVGDMPEEAFRRHADTVLDWVVGYLRGSDAPVLSRAEPGDLLRALPASAPDAGESFDRLFEDFERLILPGITHWNQPGFLAYFSSSGSAPGILGEMLSAALNINAMVWATSPAATELEMRVARWLARMLGLPDSFEGVINDTGSSSTLYALVAAREARVPEAVESGLTQAPPCRVYASTEAHASVGKAVRVLGFGREGLRRIPTAGGGMDPAALQAAIEEDLRAGHRPVAVCGTVGTTSVGAVDPADELADVAEAFGLWFHVDAAYAGSAAVLPELRHRFAGWERADSIVVNPHKWMFTPIDCSMLFCRRPAALVEAFRFTAAYLRTDAGEGMPHLKDYGVSLGRRFRALKLWFVIRSFGVEGIRERLRAHVRWARSFADRVDEDDAWELYDDPGFSTVAFRYLGEGRSPEARDELNRAIVERVNRGGEVYLSDTVLDGRVWIRLSIGHVRTTEAHVLRAWTLLTEAASA